jgi:8-oxo-dGTP pyrophosphatase MutT (NUDIX family)
VVDRAELVTLVAAHRPADARERSAKTRFLAELERLETPWDESADPVHVTASAVVVGPRGALLHLHRLLGVWLQPGGHLEPGESPPDAARREVTEETGLDARPPDGRPVLLRLDVHRGGPARRHTHLDLCYLLCAPDLDPVPGPGESPDVRWFGWEEARAVADEALRGALDAARAVVA